MTEANGFVQVGRQVPVFGNITGKKTMGEIKSGIPKTENKPVVEVKPLQ
jgi:hypothetical protein